MHGTSLRVGICFDPALLTARRFAARLAALDVLLFPELVDGGYAAIRRGSSPHETGDSFLSAFQQASLRFSCTCIAGSVFFSSAGSRRTNTALVFSRGRPIHRYDKIHLFRPTLDHRYFLRGREAGTFTLALRGARLRAGVVICFDLRFPELVRLMALQGMRILFVPARWPAVRDDAWRTLLKARAVENQIFTVGCNSCDDEGGYSYAFDPTGELVFSSRGKPASFLHAFSLDLGRIDRARRQHDNIAEAVLLRRLRSVLPHRM